MLFVKKQITFANNILSLRLTQNYNMTRHVEGQAGHWRLPTARESDQRRSDSLFGATMRGLVCPWENHTIPIPQWTGDSFFHVRVFRRALF
jgi:hypothetical protein